MGCWDNSHLPAFESVRLKEEADLVVKAVKWFSGLTVADAQLPQEQTEFPPLYPPARLSSKYTYRLPLLHNKQ